VKKVELGLRLCGPGAQRAAPLHVLWRAEVGGEMDMGAGGSRAAEDPAEDPAGPYTRADERLYTGVVGGGGRRGGGQMVMTSLPTKLEEDWWR
jgi:hypothetical protein